MEDIFNNCPLIAIIHNISKNQIRYLNSKIKDYDFGLEIRYLLMVYDNPHCSQDDLVNLYGESKANVAKSLKKLEKQNLIKREINPNNRRKYMLKTTSDGDKLVPKIRKISKDWERDVGFIGDVELKDKLKKIAINGMELIGE